MIQDIINGARNEAFAAADATGLYAHILSIIY